jgi:glycosyltransferase involved in cell wall biosynthesis
MPVILIEAMKSGVIPLVNDIEGGIGELVINNETGYKVFENHVEEYIEKINELTVDRDKALKMQHNCVALANHLFDPVENTRAIEKFTLTYFLEGERRNITKSVWLEAR